VRCLPADRHREPRGQALAGPAGQGHSTLLALVMALPDPFAVTPRVLGLDEFALRKEHNSCGTVLVDCETRAAVDDLLPEREAVTFAAWLTPSTRHGAHLP
jgi:hypothetical protein